MNIGDILMLIIMLPTGILSVLNIIGIMKSANSDKLTDKNQD